MSLGVVDGGTPTGARKWRGVVPGPASERRPECVEAWPECESGAYDPRCCRFPKSCSCSVPGPASVSPAEPPAWIMAVAEARVAQSELSWLGGFLSTALPDRADLPERTDLAYRAIARLIAAVKP